MATVYLAEDLKHDRKVAIKVLKPDLAAVLGADRFVRVPAASGTALAGRTHRRAQLVVELKRLMTAAGSAK